MILAGGTGGHVFPALAVAKKIEQQCIPIIWVGTKNSIEAKVVTAAGYQFERVFISGLRGKGVVAYTIAPLKLLFASMQSIWLLLKHRPCAVLGMGGFVAAPVGLMAVLLRRPLIIHEQNAIAGLTNRILAPFAKYILTGFPSTFACKNVEVVGNPVRDEISQIQRTCTIGEPANRPIRILVIGGSLGAQAFNKIVPAALAQIPLNGRPEVWHQTGEHNLQFTQNEYEHHAVEARVDAFIEAMHAAYLWADIVICRAGAITVAELAAAGVGAIFVPYPHAVDNHQTANAAALTNAGAAYLIQEHDLDATTLANHLCEISANRSKLKRIAQLIRNFAKPQAAADVAKICLQVCLDKNSARPRLVKDY